MDAKEELQLVRNEIDNIDDRIVELFQKRMQAADKVASIKASGNISIVDHKREEQVIKVALEKSRPEFGEDTVTFMNTLMSISKLRQTRKLSPSKAIEFPLSASPKTQDLKVAYQGVVGAWGEHCARELFADAKLLGNEYFEDVFEVVKSGEVDYGVLPIENSQTGAIGEVYDLLRTHFCYIVGETWITIAHCLLALEGTLQSDIREVFSHPEGFKQCRRFMKDKNWDFTACKNTAMAAELVHERGEKRNAAIGSRRAAQAHGLEVLKEDIMDNIGNKTRFIVIAAQPIYNEDSTSVSVTFSTAHRSGALCAVLQTFMLAGINLTRIESRPLSSDRYRFFADLEANILAPSVKSALERAATLSDYFEILGCYCGETVRQGGA